MMPYSPPFRYPTPAADSQGLTGFVTESSSGDVKGSSFDSNDYAGSTLPSTNPPTLNPHTKTPSKIPSQDWTAQLSNPRNTCHPTSSPPLHPATWPTLLPTRALAACGFWRESRVLGLPRACQLQILEVGRCWGACWWRANKAANSVTLVTMMFKV